MHVLQQCTLLKIEDILPFFPDFVTIDEFKKHIVESLENYNTEITLKKQKMTFATDSAEAIRKDIIQLKSTFGVVSGSDNCGCCGFPVYYLNNRYLCT